MKEKLVAGKVAGIVCEYNPFHLGHQWMIRQLRARGVETIVCVMSGPFVQRAEAACLPTFLRARAAVAGGADLVFRLPVPWAVASAERFAEGAVELLAALGCVDVVAFGAEVANTKVLCETAQTLQTETFRQQLHVRLQKGENFAAARAAAVEAVQPGAADLLQSPNNILAVEYCKALQSGVHLRGGEAAPRPLALPRMGAAHDGVPSEGFASASWLRERQREEGAAAWKPYVPKACQTLYVQAEAEGLFLDARSFELMVLSRLRDLPAKQFAKAAGAGEGLENRMAKAARDATNLSELYALGKSKRYTHSRVRRLCLSAALGIPRQGLGTPAFLQLLAASGRGMSLLKTAKKTSRLPLSASAAKLSKTGPEAAKQVLLEARAEDLQALCRRKTAPGGELFTKPVQIVLEEETDG